MKSMLRAVRCVLVLELFVVALPVTQAEAQPFAYVTNAFSDTVSVIDVATNTVVATVPSGRFLSG
jgi:DNA-binding beta-propeller fold protein YncE